jgi:hypothetical protein
MAVARTIKHRVAIMAVEELNRSFDNNYICCWNSFVHIQEWAYEAYRQSFTEKKKIICTETPYMSREYFNAPDNRSDEELYVRVGWGDVSTYHPKHFNIKRQHNPQRFEGILKKQDRHLSSDWRKTGEHILFPLQVPCDSSLRGLDIWAAAQYDLIKLRQNTDRDIILTMHPDTQNREYAKKRFSDSNQHFEKFKEVVAMVGAEISNVDTHQLLENCWCVVTYSSGVSFDAILRGIPVITMSNRSFAAPICSHYIEEIETPKMVDRISWFSNVAYCEWNIEEIKRGVCREHLLS